MIQKYHEGKMGFDRIASTQAAALGFLAWLMVANADSVTISGQVELLDRRGRPAAKVTEDNPCIVFILPADEATSERLRHTPPVTVWLNQLDKKFIPRVTPVQKGGKVRFGNADPFFHNIYSKNPAFNLGRYPRGFYREQQFDEPGIVHIFCDIHPTMHAIILVVDTPLYVTVEPDWTFALEPVPVGRYRLVGWNEKTGYREQEIHVGDDDITGIVITLQEGERGPETASAQP